LELLTDFWSDVAVFGMESPEIVLESIYVIQTEVGLPDLPDDLKHIECPSPDRYWKRGQRSDGCVSLAYVGRSARDSILDDSKFALWGDRIQPNVAADPSGAPGRCREGFPLFDGRRREKE
jgi:hypothetical protein